MNKDKHCLKRNGLHKGRAVEQDEPKPVPFKQMVQRDEAGTRQG